MHIIKTVSAIILMGGTAVAQDHSGHTVGAMPGYMAAMDKMMVSMKDMKTTDNADADFLIMMIPHHQSAIDMAEVELEHGSDAATREMAQQIIDAQQAEIAEMIAMLQRMGVEAPK